MLYALFDIIKRPAEEVRRLPKWAWIILLFLFEPIVGILYLLLGRPRKGGGNGWRRGKPRIIPPDDDPDFLKKL